MVELRLDEPTFWRTMTPARCMALYREHFRPPVSKSDTARPASPSLSEYLMKGGA